MGEEKKYITPYTGDKEQMEATSCHVEERRKGRERRMAVRELHEKLIKRNSADSGQGDNGDMDTENALWQCVIAYQNYPFYTSSGLPFSYIVKCRKDGEYSGELVVSRKEGSKTLTKSSVVLAFRTVREEIEIGASSDKSGEPMTLLITPEYKGPKAIGQIFGISYVYSLFWRWGLIKVPGKVEDKLRGKIERKREDNT